jgi:anaerobic selenocysteine-containing dehydrogenase
LFTELEHVPIAEYCRRAGLDEDLVRAVARRLSQAESVSILEDLGIQQAPHSTLNSYLEKLLFLLTGNFGNPGGMNLHSGIAKLGGDFGRDTEAPVSGERIIIGLLPGNAIAEEILTDDPRRLRAMIVESANPAHSLADSQRMREALERLDLVVVFDIAMTETARLADYVLPAPSQFEKWEASFFCLEFPKNAFQLRRPILEAPPGLLPESEIHTRLVRESGALDGIDLDALRAAAERDRGEFAAMLFGLVGEQPELRRMLPAIVHESLGRTLPDGAASASFLWLQAQGLAQLMPDSVRRAGFEGDGLELGEALFDAIMERESGLVFTVDDYDETWSRVANPDRRVTLSVPELLEELGRLGGEPETRDPDFPFVLSAGERRAHTANTIYRDPTWRKTDAEGALRLHPDDAQRLGISDGGRARLTTKRGSVETVVEVTDTLQPGYVTLPNGMGTSYPDEGDGSDRVHGVPPNELTASEDRDWLAGTPHHKHVAARLEAV